MSKKKSDDERAETSDAAEAPAMTGYVEEAVDQVPPSHVDDAPAAKKTIENWRAELGTPAWLWAGMKIGLGFPIGKELTRAEYEMALEWAANVECR
jgi:hypothetical protein